LLDSGALYRLVAHAASSAGIGLEREDELAALASSLPADFHDGGDGITVSLGGRDVTDAIRSEACGSAASEVAALPAVRTALLDRQRAFVRPPGLVADGRDMGTVVFPCAPLKIFLTASPAERARRRYKQLKQKGIGVSLAQLLEDISRRDERDQRRSVSPLKPAADAKILDTTCLGIMEVEAYVKRLIRESGLA
jgi:cytidylate kinase